MKLNFTYMEDKPGRKGALGHVIDGAYTITKQGALIKTAYAEISDETLFIIANNVVRVLFTSISINSF